MVERQSAVFPQNLVFLAFAIWGWPAEEENAHVLDHDTSGSPVFLSTNRRISILEPRLRMRLSMRFFAHKNGQIPTPYGCFFAKNRADKTYASPHPDPWQKANYPFPGPFPKFQTTQLSCKTRHMDKCKICDSFPATQRLELSPGKHTPGPTKLWNTRLSSA